MDVEREILELKRRVGDLEGTVNVLAVNFGRIQPEIEALREATRPRFDALEELIQRMVGKMDALNAQVWSLRDDMPILLSDVLKKSRDRLV